MISKLLFPGQPGKSEVEFPGHVMTCWHNVLCPLHQCYSLIYCNAAWAIQSGLILLPRTHLHFMSLLRGIVSVWLINKPRFVQQFFQAEFAIYYHASARYAQWLNSLKFLPSEALWKYTMDIRSLFCTGTCAIHLDGNLSLECLLVFSYFPTLVIVCSRPISLLKKTADSSPTPPLTWPAPHR